MRANLNLTLLLLVGQGYIIGTYASLLPAIGIAPVSPMTVAIVYYLMLSLIIRKYGFFLTIIVTLCFLSFFLAFRFHRNLSLGAVWISINSHSLPVILYAYALLPFSFFAISADFYAIVYQIPLYFGRTILIPILIKRELIRLRYVSIIDNLLSRGVSVSFWKKFWTMHLWLLPLYRTTIMEGTETYEYNSMLQTDIRGFGSKKSELGITAGHKVLILLVLATTLIRIVLWINS